VAAGSYSSGRLETLKASFSDETFLKHMFHLHAKNRGGKLNQKAFACLVLSLGLEMDDDNSKRIFEEIDTNSLGVIRFQQFKKWWRNDTSNETRDTNNGDFEASV